MTSLVFGKVIDGEGSPQHMTDQDLYTPAQIPLQDMSLLVRIPREWAEDRTTDVKTSIQTLSHIAVFLITGPQTTTRRQETTHQGCLQRETEEFIIIVIMIMQLIIMIVHITSMIIVTTITTIMRAMNITITAPLGGEKVLRDRNT